MKKTISLALFGLTAIAMFSVTAASAAVIDFNGFANGDNVTSVNLGFGTVTVSATGGINQAWAYDTTNTSNDDLDLIGPFSTIDNSVTGYNAGNVLIIQENLDTRTNGRSDDGVGGIDGNNPDDNAGGGTITFSFNSVVTLSSMDVMDMDAGTAKINFFDASNQQIANPLTTAGDWVNVDNADRLDGETPHRFETILFGTGIAGVSRMEITLMGSGGIDNINVSAVPVPAAIWLFGSAIAGFIGFGRRKA